MFVAEEPEEGQPSLRTVLIAFQHLMSWTVAKSNTMADKDVLTTEHLERDKQALELEKVQQRTTIINDIPLQEALDNHLDEDPKRLRRITRKVDLRLTLVLAVLYTFAFIDRSNLGNVR